MACGGLGRITAGDPAGGRWRTGGMAASTTTTSTDYRSLHPALFDRMTRLGRSLSPDQWLAPSLCDGWRVCDVYGHMTFGGVTPMVRVVPTLLFRYRANLHRGSLVESRRFADRHPQDELLDGFERSGRHPIGIGRLVKPHELYLDHMIHELDVRRPLGLASAWGADELRAGLDALPLVRGPLFNSAKRIAGRHLIATDVDWSWGDPVDPVLEDTAENLLLRVGGRLAA